MAQVEYAVHIDASPERVWQAMIDVERWPEFAAQFRSIGWVGQGPRTLGSSARVALRPVSSATWTVTEYTEGRSFTWEADAIPGLHLVAGHSVEPEGGGSRVRLWLRSSGVLAVPFAPAALVIFRRNLRLEAGGMKTYCEGGAP